MEKEKRKQKPKNIFSLERWKLLILPSLFLLGVLCLFFSIVLFPFFFDAVSDSISYRQNYSVWQNTGIERYSYVIEYCEAGLCEIAQIFALNNRVRVNLIEENEYRSFGFGDIYRVFDIAQRCRIMCTVTYNEELGFPVKINDFDYSIEITNFTANK